MSDATTLLTEAEAARALDAKTILVPAKETGKARFRVSLDVIKSAYIAGATEAELCEQYALTPEQALKIVTDNKLPALRKAYVEQGIAAISQIQIGQAQKLLEIEGRFKALKVVQLEELLKAYAAHFTRYGHLFKVHPTTGEVLKDVNDMPMKLPIPNIINDLKDMKEAVVLNEGLKKMLVNLDDIIKPRGKLTEDTGTVVDLERDFDGLFKPRET